MNIEGEKRYVTAVAQEQEIAICLINELNKKDKTCIST